MGGLLDKTLGQYDFLLSGVFQFTRGHGIRLTLNIQLIWVPVFAFNFATRVDMEEFFKEGGGGEGGGWYLGVAK